MRIGLRERLLPVVTMGVLAALLPAAVLVLFRDVTVSLTGQVHFYSVGFSACAAAAAALGLTVVGARRSDTRTVLVGTAFAVMASLLALHGLSTPGVWFGDNGVVAITGGATLPAGAVLLTLSILPLPRVLQSIRSLLILEGVLLAVVIGLGISALAWPSLLPAVPAPNSGAAIGLLPVGIVAYALLVLRAARTFLLTQRAAQSFGGVVNIREAKELLAGQMGRGSVHHVAFRAADDAAQAAMARKLAENHGLQHTVQLDRQYFRSVYFREPGGVLFEIATDAPGFAIDEPVQSLGKELKLPPFLEPRRKEIEAALPPLENMERAA